ncbi:hypothetical protein [Vibrio sp. Hal054]|uniref:hypothetical protein n=1 Tax=Vibrio sp. Hal054 TaxID=3035158 RepID=UPI00301DC9A8
MYDVNEVIAGFNAISLGAIAISLVAMIALKYSESTNPKANVSPSDLITSKRLWACVGVINIFLSFATTYIAFYMKVSIAGLAAPLFITLVIGSLGVRFVGEWLTFKAPLDVRPFRYLVFAGRDYYPVGGALDFRNAFQEKDEAEMVAESLLGKVFQTIDPQLDEEQTGELIVQWSHVYDIETRQCIAFFGTKREEDSVLVQWDQPATNKQEHGHYVASFISSDLATAYAGTIESLVPAITTFATDNSISTIAQSDEALHAFARLVIEKLRKSTVYRIFGLTDYGDQSVYVESFLAHEDMVDVCRYLCGKGEIILSTELDAQAVSPCNFAIAATLIAHYGCAPALRDESALDLDMHCISETAGNGNQLNSRYARWVPKDEARMMATLRTYVANPNGLDSVNSHYAKYHQQ